MSIDGENRRKQKTTPLEQPSCTPENVPQIFIFYLYNTEQDRLVLRGPALHYYTEELNPNNHRSTMMTICCVLIKKLTNFQTISTTDFRSRTTY